MFDERVLFGTRPMRPAEPPDSEERERGKEGEGAADGLRERSSDMVGAGWGTGGRAAGVWVTLFSAGAGYIPVRYILHAQA